MPNYNDTPLAADRINDTQSLIRENFNSIDTAWQINHVDITDGADYGKHSGADFVEVTNHPTVDADDVTLYNFVDPITTTNELYVKKTGALGVAGTPFTSVRAQVADGYTYLPSGLLIRWGHSTAIGVDTIVINTAPYFTNIYNVQLSVSNPTNTNRSITLRTATVNAGVSFTLNCDGAVRTTDDPIGVDFDYFIIGV